MTGTHIARRDQCESSSDETRERAQRELESLQREQQGMQLPRPDGTMR